MLTAEIIKRKAKEWGADLVGIGDISLFEGEIAQRDPRQILPRATCVIGFGFRVPRGLYNVMERGGQFFNYTQLGVKFIDEEFAEIFLLKMGGLIENEGYDACLQRNISNLRIKGDKTTNAEVNDTYELVHASPVAPGKPTPDIIMDFAKSAQICGLGEVSMRGTVITPRFGPFVRFAFIVTDAPLECDAPFTPNLCDRCGDCVKACPGHAIAEDGAMNTWQCAVYYRGAHRSNPFMTDECMKDEPDREAILNGDKVFDRDGARALYKKLNFLPSSTTGYAPCLCGKRCDMACYNHLKERGLVK